MDEIFEFILDLWYRVLNILSSFEVGFFGFSFSLLSFFIGIIVFNILFKVLLILPSRDDSVRLGKSIIKKYDGGNLNE